MLCIRMLGFVLTILLSTPALYEDSVADKLIRSATESTYLLHLSEARAGARELQRKYSDHPAERQEPGPAWIWNSSAADPGDRHIKNKSHFGRYRVR